MRISERAPCFLRLFVENARTSSFKVGMGRRFMWKRRLHWATAEQKVKKKRKDWAAVGSSLIAAPIDKVFLFYRERS
jgi:hypothetical protein